MAASAKQLGAGAVDDLPPPNRLASYKGGSEMEPDGDESAGDDAMGSALAAAIKSGNGAAITAAFRDLSDHTAAG